MERDPKFYDSGAETSVGVNRLPHWDQRGRTYFITFRLADSVPADLLKKHAEEEAAWVRIHPQPWDGETEQEYHRRFSGQIEGWLDRGMGECVLRDPATACVMAEALGFHDSVKHVLHAWVVMPNHVHVLVETLGEQSLPALLQSWKGYTARKINEMSGKSGSLWQKSYFDRLIRGWEHFGNCVRYIRKNPVKARLKEDEFLMGESVLAQRF